MRLARLIAIRPDFQFIGTGITAESTSAVDNHIFVLAWRKRDLSENVDLRSVCIVAEDAN